MAKSREKTAAFHATAAVTLPVFGAMARVRVRNPEALPQEGPFILAPNHYSEIDPIVMGVAVWKSGRAPHFMAKASLWKIPVVKQILNGLKQIPVERSRTKTSGSAPMDAAAQIIEDQAGVIVYPEGTLTRDPEMWPMRGKNGAVRLAVDAGIPLIPAAHWGTHRLMPRYGRGIRPFPRKRIDVVFGAPIDLSGVTNSHSNKQVTAATAELMNSISALVGELRGLEPPKERWDPARAGQSETGRFSE
ncbi:lysophospholipid acyltransferase family protein [Agrococcus casei]|uniref:lysophospholipid acyltransferase family protein n=1 Tax=Agrococcus casei TaxID=343512 RepID=UPI003F9022C8